MKDDGKKQKIRMNDFYFKVLIINCLCVDVVTKRLQKEFCNRFVVFIGFQIVSKLLFYG